MAAEAARTAVSARPVPATSWNTSRVRSRRLLPTEVRRPLQAQPLHARPQFGIQQQVRDGAHDLVHAIGVEQDGGAIHHFRQRDGVGTGHRAPAGHGFQRGQPETFVKRREDEQVAGVVELQQVVVGDEAEELDAVRHARFARGFVNAVREPGGFPGQHQVVLELRIGAHQAGESADQADLVLARLKIAHRKQERAPDTGNRSRTVAAAASREMGRNSEAAALGTTTTLSSSRSP